MSELLPVQSTTPIYLEGSKADHNTAGRLLEHAAVGATLVRGLGAVANFYSIMNSEEYRSWSSVARFGVYASTDFIDGKLARLGRRLQGKDENTPRPLRSYLDHLTDKGLVDSTVIAIGMKEINKGNTKYGNTLLAAAGVTVARDALTTADRIIADVQGIDTRAQSSGKAKAVKQFLAVGFALSPLAKSVAGQTISGTALLWTAKDSVSSGLDLHRHFKIRRKERK